MKKAFIVRASFALIAAALLIGLAASAVWAQAQCAVGQFRGRYFKDGKQVFARCEPRIDFDWGTLGPEAGSSATDDKADGPSSRTVGVDNFRVRWTGRFHFNGGTYRFIVVADDGVKLTVDGAVIIDQWRSQSATEFSAMKRLTPGEHVVDVEYFEDKDDATIKVRWVRSGS